MKLSKKLLAMAVAVLPVAANAQVNITFEDNDFANVGVYDWWEESPFRIGGLTGNCKVVANPDAALEESANTSEKVLGFQRSRYGSNMFGARIDLKPEQRFVLTPAVQYVHVLMKKPVNGRSMIIGLGRHNENTPGYADAWATQKEDVVQFTALGNNKAPADQWTDVVFPIKGAGNIDIYSLVVVPDCEAPHNLTSDFAVYIDNVKVNTSSAPEIALVGDYPICYDKDQVYTHSAGRKLNSLTVTTAAGTYTKNGNGNFCYTEAFDGFIVAKPGETVTAKCNYSGAWMHSFFYLDKNQDGKFNIEDGELVAFKNNDKDAFGVTHTFTIPAELQPGIYRLRGKVDWESKDPAGNDGSSGSNFIVSNGGGIIDVLLNVYDPAQTKVNVTNEQRNGDILLADGSTIDNYQHDRLTALKVKADPSNGFYCAGMKIRHGYFGGEDVVHSNPQWLEAEVSYTQFADDDTYVIPAGLFDGDVRIEGLMEAGTKPEPEPEPEKPATFPFVSPTPVDGQWVNGTTSYYIQNGAVERAWVSTASAYTDASGNLRLANGTQPADEEGRWVVCGNDVDGYSFYNVAEGPNKVLGLVGDDKNARVKMYTIGTEGTANTRFDYHANGAGYSFRIHGTEYNCFNSRDQYLALWSDSRAFSTDDGSRFTFTFAEDIPVTPVGLDAVLSPETMEIYDLSGRRVQQATQGLYIQNRRKVFVKK